MGRVWRSPEQGRRWIPGLLPVFVLAVFVLAGAFKPLRPWLVPPAQDREVGAEGGRPLADQVPEHGHQHRVALRVAGQQVVHGRRVAVDVVRKRPGHDPCWPIRRPSRTWFSGWRNPRPLGDDSAFLADGTPRARRWFPAPAEEGALGG